MPRYYIRKSTRSSWSEESLKSALEAIERDKISLRKAAKIYNIPASTLRQHAANPGKPLKCRMGRKPVFTKEQEEEIVSYILNESKFSMGFTSNDVRRIAYDFAERNGIENNFNAQKKMCGKDWLYGLMQRHPQLRLRKREGIAEMTENESGLIREALNLFYDEIEKFVRVHNLEAQRIYNVDETSLNTTHVPCRAITWRGQSKELLRSDDETEPAITVVCAINAIGQYVPPLLIFKKDKINVNVEESGPIGSICRCSTSGVITNELFAEWLRHFVKFAKPTKDDPVLLIFNNDSTHSTLSSYRFCKESGIVLVSLPPHTSTKLQPLDVSFYGPLKAAYRAEYDKHAKSTRCSSVEDSTVVEIFRYAYYKAATVGNAVKGFQSTGIFPLDRSIFEPDIEFVSVTGETMHQVPEEHYMDVLIKSMESNDPAPGPSGAVKVERSFRKKLRSDGNSNFQQEFSRARRKGTHFRIGLIENY